MLGINTCTCVHRGHTPLTLNLPELVSSRVNILPCMVHMRHKEVKVRDGVEVQSEGFDRSFIHLPIAAPVPETQSY